MDQQNPHRSDQDPNEEGEQQHNPNQTYQYDYEMHVPDHPQHLNFQFNPLEDSTPRPLECDGTGLVVPNEPPPEAPNPELEPEPTHGKVVTVVDKKLQSLQARSRFGIPFVRRKFNRAGKLQHWQAEVRKPPELIEIHNRVLREDARRRNASITDAQLLALHAHPLIELKRSFLTDTEAELAGTVVAELFEDFVNPIRERDNIIRMEHGLKVRKPLRYQNKRFTVASRWLINSMVVSGVGLPDPASIDHVRGFAAQCAAEFKRIADAAKNNDVVCPPELEGAVHEYIYNSWRYDRLYQSHEIPQSKQNPKNTAGRCTSSRSWIELEGCCGVHPRSKRVRWFVDNKCLCRGNTYRLTLP